jgi:hypothetical protein
MAQPFEVTLEMGAPPGAGHQLTAAAVALQDHMNWAPL